TRFSRDWSSDVCSSDLTLSKTGIELVGVKLNETIITEDEDPSLRDPASGVPNFGQAGAHRIKAEAVLTLNDSDAVTIYEFEDGRSEERRVGKECRYRWE